MSQQVDFIRSEMVTAMKNKDKERKEVLSLLLSALKQYEIDNRTEITDEIAGQVVLKQMKQLKETLELTPADRTEIIEQCNFSLSVLSEYAPKMMSEIEIKMAIDDVLVQLGIIEPTAKDKGNIMKLLMPAVKGKADGKLVNDVLASMMKG